MGAAKHKPEYFTLTYGECGPHYYATLDFMLMLTTAQYALRAPKGILLQDPPPPVPGPVQTWDPPSCTNLITFVPPQISTNMFT